MRKYKRFWGRNTCDVIILTRFDSFSEHFFARYKYLAHTVYVHGVRFPEITEMLNMSIMSMEARKSYFTFGIEYISQSTAMQVGLIEGIAGKAFI